MRIVLLDPEDPTVKVGVVTSFAELRQAFPRVSWATASPSDTLLEELGLAARNSVETEPPEFAPTIQRLVADDERQQDGTWQQTWTVEETISLADAKQYLAALAIELYWQKTVVEPPNLTDLTDANADPAAVITERRDRFRPVLIQVRNAIVNATTVVECWTIYKQLRDAA